MSKCLWRRRTMVRIFSKWLLINVVVVALTLRTVGWAAAVISQGLSLGTIYAIQQHLRDVICVSLTHWCCSIQDGILWTSGKEVVGGIKLSRYYGYLGVEIHDARVKGYCKTWTFIAISPWSRRREKQGVRDMFWNLWWSRGCVVVSQLR